MSVESNERSPLAGREERGGRRRAIASIVGVALVLTVCNAVKPLIVDDTALVAFAEQISQHPTDPYGFEMLWWIEPEPANHILMPPVMPYWVGLAIATFGDQPFVWKLSLFPLLLLLAASLHGMLRRFVPGWEHPLLWMMLLSPAVFPSVNLMLDVPALAFGMAALWTLLVVTERGGLGRVVLAGLLAGASLQTKYTGLVWLIALLCLGGTHHRLREAVIAAAIASAVFVSWEIFTALQYGESHFLHALLVQEYGKDVQKVPHLWVLGFTSLAGAMVPGTAVLFCAGFGSGRRVGFALLALATVGFASIALLVGDPIAVEGRSVPSLAAPRPELFVLVPLGASVLAAIALGVGKLLRAPTDAATQRIDRFLALWLLVETAAFFFISPFLAGRRLIGWSVPLLFLAGRFAARAPERVDRGASSGTLRSWAAGFSVALGLLFAVSDLTDARARSGAILRAERRLAVLGANLATEDIWFVGHWGFRYYAEQRGMRPLIPGQSHIRAGDWLLIPEGVERSPFALPAEPTRFVAEVRVENPWPWSTLPSLYLGPIAIRAQADSQLLVKIVQFQAPFLAPLPAQKVPVP